MNQIHSKQFFLIKSLSSQSWVLYNTYLYHGLKTRKNSLSFDRKKTKINYNKIKTNQDFLCAQILIFLNFSSLAQANFEILAALLVRPVPSFRSLCCSGCNSRRKPVLWRTLCQNTIWARRWNSSSEYKTHPLADLFKIRIYSTFLHRISAAWSGLGET